MVSSSCFAQASGLTPCLPPGHNKKAVLMSTALKKTIIKASSLEDAYVNKLICSALIPFFL